MITRGLRHLEHHVARLRGREEQARRWQDHDDRAQGPTDPRWNKARACISIAPCSRSTPMARIRTTSTTLRHGGRIRDGLAAQDSSARVRPEAGPDGEGALDLEREEPFPPSGRLGEDRHGATLSRSSRASCSAGRSRFVPVGGLWTSKRTRDRVRRGLRPWRSDVRDREHLHATPGLCGLGPLARSPRRGRRTRRRRSLRGLPCVSARAVG